MLNYEYRLLENSLKIKQNLKIESFLFLQPLPQPAQLKVKKIKTTTLG